jgi:chromosome segregation ATPase
MTEMIDESQNIANIISTTDDLLKSGLAKMDEISGSGEEEGSGWFNQPSGTVYHREVVDTKFDVESLDNDVSDMCNHTEILLTKVKGTESHLDEKQQKYDQLESDVTKFSADIDELVDEFEQSASGDAIDYSEKLMDAEIMIQKMLMRNFHDMKDVADAEFDEAQQLFFDVERNFTLIAADMNDDVTATTDQFASSHGKLHDLRSQMNLATANTNDATTLNAVNKQDLSKLQQDIEKINGDIEATTEALEDAESSLDASNTAVEKIKAGLADMDALADVLVNTETPRLQDDIDATGDITDLQAAVDAAVEHADALRTDADALNSISTDLDTSPAGVSNSYKKTAMAMEEAEMASQDALVVSLSSTNLLINFEFWKLKPKFLSL